MKKWAITISLMFFPALTATSSDFWTIYAETLVYQHSINGGYIPSQAHLNRLDEAQTVDIALKSLNYAFTERLGQVAKEKRDYALQNCLFSREAYRCYFDEVVRTTLDEMGFMPDIHFSDRFLQKAWKMYDRSVRPNDTIEERMRRAKRVPPWKKFNPLVNVDISEPEIFIAAPFYTFFSIYVEPRWGTGTGPQVVLMKSRFFLDVDREKALLRYSLAKKPYARGYYTFYVGSDRSFWIDSMLIIK
ncbi:MAG: hypothetical protein AB1742_08460 [bacterium]